MEKTCKTCKVLKQLEHFSGYQRLECNSCRAEREARRRLTDEYRQVERRRSVERRKQDGYLAKQRNLCYSYKLKHKYGITRSQYEALGESQDWKCMICSGDDALCVDHCPTTGKVRGLLCKSCNSAIGFLRDDPDLVERAAAYLRGNIIGGL